MAEPRTRPGMVLIFTPYITLKGGKRLYAPNYGKKVFAIWVKKEKLKPTS